MLYGMISFVRTASYAGIAISLIQLAGCTEFPIKTAPTAGEQVLAQHPSKNPSYGYTPLDPLPVPVNSAVKPDQVLTLLGDTTSRLAIADVEGNIAANYGPVKVGVAGQDYQVVVDYIQYTTKSLPFKISKNKDGTTGEKTVAQRLDQKDAGSADFLIPVYVGVGLRFTASLHVISGNINLANIFSLGAAADAKQIQGQMVIQTLGLSGESVSTAQTIPTDISTATISNALVTLGTIKSKIYDSSKVIVKPRVVAIYNPISTSGPDTVNAIISNILQNPQALELKPE